MSIELVKSDMIGRFYLVRETNCNSFAWIRGQCRVVDKASEDETENNTCAYMSAIIAVLIDETRVALIACRQSIIEY